MSLGLTFCRAGPTSVSKEQGKLGNTVSCDCCIRKDLKHSPAEVFYGMQIEFSGYTLAPLQPQFTEHDKSQETLITHIIKARHCRLLDRDIHPCLILLQDRGEDAGIYQSPCTPRRPVDGAT